MVLHELARVYEAQSDYNASIQVEQRALSIYEKTQGVEAQYIISTLLHLAKLYQSQTNYEQSASYYQRALAIQEKELGIEHPDTIQTIREYAALLRAMGRENDAVALEARIQQE
jgi:tetratricopeptide (TPR) repeat protein